MKASQRFRLNRLADKLVTPERFASLFGEMDLSPSIIREGGVVIFDEMDAVTPTCPYGEEDTCPSLGQPIGLGLHTPCAERELQRLKGTYLAGPRGVEPWLREVGLTREDFDGPGHRESRA